MAQRLFTVHEANALIPMLELIMGDLQRQSMRLREYIREVAAGTAIAPEHLQTARLVELRPEVAPVLEDMQRLLQNIEACGGELKGLDLGLVDFPGELDGKRILLCWQYGEKEIGYYHSPNSGFGGRKPLRKGVPPLHSVQ